MDNIERISKLYSSQGGRRTDFSHFKKSPRPRSGWIVGFVLGVIFLAAAAALAGFLIFNQRGNDKIVEEGQEFLKIEGPKEVSLGEEVSFSVFVFNPQEAALTSADLELILPQDFKLAEFEPEPSSVLTHGGIWDLGTLKPNETREIILRGTCFGQFGQEQKILAFFNFEPADFTSTFQKKTDFSIELKNPLLEASFVAPDKIIEGQFGDYSWKVKNIAEKTVDNIGVILEYPQGFSIRNGMEPGSDTIAAFFLSRSLPNESRWFIKQLEEEEEKEIGFGGKIVGQPGNWQFKLRIGLVDEEGKFYLEKEKTEFVFLEDIGLNLYLKVTGQEEKHWGDALNYEISLENIAAYSIDDLAVKLKVDKRLFDLTRLERWQWQIGGQVVKNGPIAGGLQFSKLGRLASGQTGRLAFTLYLKSAEAVAGLGIAKIDVSSQIQVSGQATPPKLNQTIEFEKYSEQVFYKIEE